MEKIAGLGDWQERKSQGRNGGSREGRCPETQPSGNFDAKIVLSNLESLRLGYKWLPDSHSGKLPILPKTQALPGLSSFCLSHPFAYTPRFSPTAPVRKPFSFLNKIPSSWSFSWSPPSHLPTSGNLTLAHGGGFLGSTGEDSRSPPTGGRGQAHWSSLTGGNVHSPHVLPSVLLKHFYLFLIWMLLV